MWEELVGFRVAIQAQVLEWFNMLFGIMAHIGLLYL